jgi:murein DD-endopeptidase MepM/ murein hydrolase activator NlpD
MLNGKKEEHHAGDFNYNVGQNGINLMHPTVRSPVAGVVTRAGQGKYATIAITDADGFSHEILHTHSQHVAIGDPVAAGQIIGTMGNTGGANQKQWPARGSARALPIEESRRRHH